MSSTPVTHDQQMHSAQGSAWTPTHGEPESLAGCAPDAAVIGCESPGSFAHGVLRDRHPALIAQVRAAFPYGPRQQARLDALLTEITTGVIEPLPTGAHDHQAWNTWGQGLFGRSWFAAPFLWAESYFYRRLLEAVDYYTPGPWQGIDPFEPAKTAELAEAALDADLTAMATPAPVGPAAATEAATVPVADEVTGAASCALATDPERPAGRSSRAHGHRLLLAALWGNQADLGFRLSVATSREPHPENERPEDAGPAGTEPPSRVAGLVADDSPAFWAALDDRPGGAVHVVADNAGRELLADLALIDHLLHTGLAATLTLHLKSAPYYVSDALTADVAACLRRLGAVGGHPADVAERLHTAASRGRFTLATHPFWCAPVSFHHLPSELATAFGSATVTVLKGDLNYRRLVGDCHRHPTTSFAAVAGYFPGPVCALRTLKSDVIVGLAPATLADLNASGTRWRTSGIHGLVQFHGHGVDGGR